MFAGMWSPKSRSLSACASRKNAERVCRSTAAIGSSRPGNTTPVSTTIFPVGTAEVETTASVRPGSVVWRFFGFAAPRRSKPR